jgi:hypothetical protein
MITAYQRGHRIYFNNGKWCYLDNNEPIAKERPCLKCGRMPTPEGYDTCLGYIDGVISACCGHGVEKQILTKESIGLCN